MSINYEGFTTNNQKCSSPTMHNWTVNLLAMAVRGGVSRLKREGLELLMKWKLGGYDRANTSHCVDCKSFCKTSTISQTTDLDGPMSDRLSPFSRWKLKEFNFPLSFAIKPFSFELLSIRWGTGKQEWSGWIYPWPHNSTKFSDHSKKRELQHQQKTSYI